MGSAGVLGAALIFGVPHVQAPSPRGSSCQDVAAPAVSKSTEPHRDGEEANFSHCTGNEVGGKEKETSPGAGSRAAVPSRQRGGCDTPSCDTGVSPGPSLWDQMFVTSARPLFPSTQV